MYIFKCVEVVYGKYNNDFAYTLCTVQYDIKWNFHLLLKVSNTIRGRFKRQDIYFIVAMPKINIRVNNKKEQKEKNIKDKTNRIERNEWKRKNCDSLKHKKEGGGSNELNMNEERAVHIVDTIECHWSWIRSQFALIIIIRRKLDTKKKTKIKLFPLYFLSFFQIEKFTHIRSNVHYLSDFFSNTIIHFLTFVILTYFNMFTPFS